MDPFSLAVGVLGITDISIFSFKQVCSTIDGLGKSREDVQHIRASLGNLLKTLDALRAFDYSDSSLPSSLKQDLEKTGVVAAVKSCSEACEVFGKNLQKWTKRSGPTKFSKRDRFLLAVWKKNKIIALRVQIADCRSRVNFALQVSQL